MRFNEYLTRIFEVMIYCIIIVFFISMVYMGIQFVINKILHRISRKKLEEANDVLKRENLALKEEAEKSRLRLARLEAQLSQHSADRVQFINVGSLKVKADDILYITSQSFENINSNGDSRVKVIHYIHSDYKDLVYSTFDVIIEQLSGNFMMINKNVLVNLREIQKVQGNDLFLKNCKKIFMISEHKKSEFDMRVARL